jgi:1-phosphofructokinase/tagatose 6-phosphate kinase
MDGFSALGYSRSMLAHESSGKTFLCVCLNPVIQKTLVFDRLHPGEVNRTSRHRIDVAGKGVCPARVLTQLGEKAVHMTQLGGPTRDWFLSMCSDDGLSVEWVESEAPIRFCTTLIETETREATELVEEAASVGSGTSERLVARFSALLPGIDAVLLSGTVAAGIEAGTMGSFAALASAAQVHLYLDIKGRDLYDCLRRRPVCVKPNLEELALTMGIPYRALKDEDAARRLVEEAGKEFHARYGSLLVVTRGSKPTLFWDGSSLGERSADIVDAVNPIGSGDAFGAGLARMLEGGASLEEAVAEGTRLGGLNAAQLKPGSIRPERI